MNKNGNEEQSEDRVLVSKSKRKKSKKKFSLEEAIGSSPMPTGEAQAHQS
jgi:hypothetical protein